MTATIGIWSHALAATLFVALALWQMRAPRTPAQRALTLALAGTAFWALVIAFATARTGAAAAAESLRNLGWLAWMALLLRQGARDARPAGLMLLYAVVAAVILAAPAVALLPPGGLAPFAANVLRLVAAIGALVLLHNLYTAADPEARAGLRLPMTGLAVLWAADLQLYALAAMDPGWSARLIDLRGLVALLAAPVFAPGLRRSDPWRMRLSRTLAFQSLSLIAILAYLGVMALVTVALGRLGGDYARLVQAGALFGTTLAALIFLPSDRFRAWIKVKLAKHLFQHRYDYRAEWLRFTETLGAPGADAPLGERVVRAIAELTDSPAGLLFTPDGQGGLMAVDQWRWGQIGAGGIAPDAAGQLACGRIVELAAEPVALPGWLAGDARAWAIVPLPHFDRLAGLVLLARPPIDRGLDWEDFDLLRVVGRQAASYLSEARGQEALAEARRFDEFNRRFAFILHDIKNLVSQLSLLARNAARHAENPEFRADMIATLNDAATRLGDLLARLAPHDRGPAEEPRALGVQGLLAGMAARAGAGRGGAGRVQLDVDADLVLLADPARLEQAVAHLVQNALDASPPGAPVVVRTRRRGLEGAIEIIDQGRGMSREFIRSELFRPFSSTKPGGFGIGAYEARALVAAMGGRIEVESHEGQGSRFTLILPRASIDEAA